LAGILIMGFFSTGFLNMGINMTYFRRKGIFKRFACTPIKKSKLISATILSNLVFMVMSFVILLIYAEIVLSCHMGHLLSGVHFVYTD